MPASIHVFRRNLLLFAQENEGRRLVQPLFHVADVVLTFIPRAIAHSIRVWIDENHLIPSSTAE